MSVLEVKEMCIRDRVYGRNKSFCSIFRFDNVKMCGLTKNMDRGYIEINQKLGGCGMEMVKAVGLKRYYDTEEKDVYKRQVKRSF